jgi:hypothetical protein
MTVSSCRRNSGMSVRDRDLLSQLNSVGQHPVGHARSKARLGGDIDVTTEELLEIHQQPAKVKQPALIVQLDQEVDIAGGVRVATSH